MAFENQGLQVLPVVHISKGTRQLCLNDNYLRVGCLQGIPESVHVVQARRNRLKGLSPLPSSVTHLDLGENRIERASDVAASAHVRSLKLDRNPLVSLGGSRRFSALVELDLSSCRLRDVSPLGAIATLSKLDVSKNCISDFYQFKGFLNLRVLCLRRNSISHVSNADMSLPLLEHLDLSSNRLGTTDFSENNMTDRAHRFPLLTALAAVSPRLLSLDLSTNALTTLEGVDWKELRSLEALSARNMEIRDVGPSFICAALNIDLSCNSLSSLGSLGRCYRLQALRVAKNAVTSLGKAAIPTLRSLDLSFNGLQSLAGISSLSPRLQVLLVTSNRIQEIVPYCAHVCDLLDLAVLDSRGNPFHFEKELQVSAPRGPPELTSPALAYPAPATDLSLSSVGPRSLDLSVLQKHDLPSSASLLSPASQQLLLSRMYGHPMSPSYNSQASLAPGGHHGSNMSANAREDISPMERYLRARARVSEPGPQCGSSLFSRSMLPQSTSPTKDISPRADPAPLLPPKKSVCYTIRPTSYRSYLVASRPTLQLLDGKLASDVRSGAGDGDELGGSPKSPKLSQRAVSSLSHDVFALVQCLIDPVVPQISLCKFPDVSGVRAQHSATPSSAKSPLKHKSKLRAPRISPLISSSSARRRSTPHTVSRLESRSLREKLGSPLTRTRRSRSLSPPPGSRDAGSYEAPALSARPASSVTTTPKPSSPLRSVSYKSPTRGDQAAVSSSTVRSSAKSTRSSPRRRLFSPKRARKHLLQRRSGMLGPSASVPSLPMTKKPRVPWIPVGSACKALAESPPLSVKPVRRKVVKKKKKTKRSTISKGCVSIGVGTVREVSVAVGPDHDPSCPRAADDSFVATDLGILLRSPRTEVVNDDRLDSPLSRKEAFMHFVDTPSSSCACRERVQQPFSASSMSPGSFVSESALGGCGASSEGDAENTAVRRYLKKTAAVYNASRSRSMKAKHLKRSRKGRSQREAQFVGRAGWMSSRSSETTSTGSENSGDSDEESTGESDSDADTETTDSQDEESDSSYNESLSNEASDATSCDTDGEDSSVSSAGTGIDRRHTSSNRGRHTIQGIRASKHEQRRSAKALAAAVRSYRRSTVYNLDEYLQRHSEAPSLQTVNPEISRIVTTTAVPRDDHSPFPETAHLQPAERYFPHDVPILPIAGQPSPDPETEQVLGHAKAVLTTPTSGSPVSSGSESLPLRHKDSPAHSLGDFASRRKLLVSARKQAEDVYWSCLDALPHVDQVKPLVGSPPLQPVKSSSPTCSEVSFFQHYHRGLVLNHDDYVNPSRAWYIPADREAIPHDTESHKQNNRHVLHCDTRGGEGTGVANSASLPMQETLARDCTQYPTTAVQTESVGASDCQSQSRGFGQHLSTAETVDHPSVAKVEESAPVRYDSPDTVVHVACESDIELGGSCSPGPASTTNSDDAYDARVRSIPVAVAPRGPLLNLTTVLLTVGPLETRTSSTGATTPDGNAAIEGNDVLSGDSQGSTCETGPITGIRESHRDVEKFDGKHEVISYIRDKPSNVLLDSVEVRPETMAQKLSLLRTISDGATDEIGEVKKSAQSKELINFVGATDSDATHGCAPELSTGTDESCTDESCADESCTDARFSHQEIHRETIVSRANAVGGQEHPTTSHQTLVDECESVVLPPSTNPCGAVSPKTNVISFAVEPNVSSDSVAMFTAALSLLGQCCSESALELDNELEVSSPSAFVDVSGDYRTFQSGSSCCSESVLLGEVSGCNSLIEDLSICTLASGGMSETTRDHGLDVTCSTHASAVECVPSMIPGCDVQHLDGVVDLAGKSKKSTPTQNFPHTRESPFKQGCRFEYPVNNSTSSTNITYGSNVDDVTLSIASPASQPYLNRRCQDLNLTATTLDADETHSLLDRQLQGTEHECMAVSPRTSSPKCCQIPYLPASPQPFLCVPTNASLSPNSSEVFQQRNNNVYTHLPPNCVLDSNTLPRTSALSSEGPVSLQSSCNSSLYEWLRPVFDESVFRKSLALDQPVPGPPRSVSVPQKEQVTVIQK
eukprot:Rmarinus@m.3941